MMSCINETDLNQKLIGFGILNGICLITENKYKYKYNEEKQIIRLSELTYHLTDFFDNLII